jgi:AraC-like DNA-binding protein
LTLRAPVSLAEIDPTLSSQFPSDAIRVREGPAFGPAQIADHEFSVPGSAGWEFGANIRHGFSVTTGDFSLDEGLGGRFASCDLLKLHIRLNGDNGIDGVGMESAVESGRMSFLVEPRDKVKQSRIGRNTHIRAVTMVCSRDFMQPLLSTIETPTVLRNYLKEPATTFYHRDAAIPPAMRLVAEQLLSLRSGALSELMFEAKALELLSLWIQTLAGSNERETLSARHRIKVEALKELLHTPAGAAMTSAQLSRELAWNETQMMESFRQVTGTTISCYRQRLRMDQAMALVRDTDRPITDIAFETGYEHPGNFASAFKRTFGFSPREMRTVATSRLN